MKPLEGVLVADFSRVLAGPMSAQILADFGARVVKIERPGIGDETRSWEPRLKKDSGYFFAFNRGKESITLDLKSEDGKEIARDIAAKADVLLENFPVGQMAKLGLDYDRLKEVNPRLIYVSNTGFGQFGPNSHKVGYDTVFQAMGGMMSLTGEKDGGPAKAGLPVADLTSGLWLAIAALTGLVGRGVSGRGCRIDVSMMDIQVSLLTIAAARFFALGEAPKREGTEHPGRVPSAAFQCADGEWLQISASDQHWLPLCEFFGLEDLATRDDLATNSGRVRNRKLVSASLKAAISKRPRKDVIKGLEARRVPVGPVNSVDQILEDENTKARNMIGSFEYPEVGPFPALRNPLLLEGFDNPAISPPPTLGQQSQSILSGLLGYDADRVRDLTAKGVV
ncbi:CaiB/BaiF CoA transferase family protein [Pelagibius sp.]|uniref:CaiB/BaiF CoA transferase family protein n=1 Tax=Pelagibius sp. TaxID=1931238 RepID=UPI003BB07631